MTDISQIAADVFADGPADTPTEPDKAEVRALFGHIQNELERIEEAQTTNRLVKATWSELAAITGTTNGQGAEVLDSDAGTHTDPVVGGTVANAGVYSWSVSPAGWKRIGSTGLSSKAPLASPALTGTPTAPTAATGTRTTQIATTAMVGAERTASEATTNAAIAAVNVPKPIPFEPALGRVVAPVIGEAAALIGGWTKDGGVFAPSGVRGAADADDPDAAVEAGSLVVSQGGATETIDGTALPFKSARTNGKAIVATRTGMPWPSARARVEGVFGGPLWPIDEDVVLGVKVIGQSTGAGTKGFTTGSTIDPEYAAPSGQGRIVMNKRKALNTDERGTYNRLNPTSYVPWVASDFLGVEEFFAFGGPGNVHGQTPAASFLRNIEEQAIFDIGRSPMLHLDNTSVGGITIAAMKSSPGTINNINNTNNPHNDDVIATGLANDYWAERGRKYAVFVVLGSQGEANDTSGTGTTWSTDFQAVRTARIAAYAAETGQPNPPWFLWWQTSTNRDESIGRGFESVLGQMIEHRAGRLVVVGPDYAVRVASGMADDYQHFNATGYRHRGDYAARALRFLLRQGTYSPLMVNAAAVSRAGATVTVPLLGTDVTDVAIDTSAMSDPGQKGFRVFDQGAGNAEIAINTVAVSGTKQLALTLASTPVGPIRLDVGLKGYTTTFGTTNPAGYVGTEQMRTNIRSTNGFAGSDGTTLYHWLCADRISGIA
jgi:hypothetical protein